MAEEKQAEAVQLSLQDVAAAVHIIDIVSKRGAFEGPELGDVGALRNKLAAFIEANRPADPEPEAEEEAETEDGG